MEGREPILNDQHPCRTTNSQATNSHTAQLSSDSSQGRLFMPSSSANLCMWNHQNVFRRSRSWAASFLVKSDEQAHATIIAGSFLRYGQVIQDSDSKFPNFILLISLLCICVSHAPPVQISTSRRDGTPARGFQILPS
jgi:hypothetical protein